MTTFPGLMSWWTTPAAWAAARPPAISLRIVVARWIGTVLFRIPCSRMIISSDAPLTNSIAKKYPSSWRPKAWTAATFG